MSEVASRARADSAEIAYRKIFIGGLSFSTDEEKLKKYFKQYGTVEDAVVMKDAISKRSRGFGFVTFSEVSAVDKALANEPHTIDSRTVEAKRAVPRSEINKDAVPGQTQKPAAPTASASTSTTTARPAQKPAAMPVKHVGTGAGAAHTTYASASSGSGAGAGAGGHEGGKHTDGKINLDDYAYNKIFVGGLHYDTRDAEFRSYFEKYGTVISAEVMFNRETHKSRGFGFIVFEVENSAVKVCAVKEHAIDGKVVEVKRAIPRSKLTPGTPTANITQSMYTSATTKPVHTFAAAALAATSGSAAAAGRPSAAGGAGAGQSGGSNSSNNTAQIPGKSVSSPSAESTSNQKVEASKPTTAPTASTRPAAASYAAALKVGTSHESSASTNTAAATAAGSAPMATNATAVGSPSGVPHSGILSNSGMTLQSLMFGAMNVQRPARSYSEPIVKFEGSSALNGDILSPEAILMGRNIGAGAIVKNPSSGPSSRSNSIVQASSSLLGGTNYADSAAGATKSPVSLGNLPWLSSPPSNSLDGGNSDFGLQLPPAGDQQQRVGGDGIVGYGGTNTNNNNNNNVNKAPPGIGNNSPWLQNQSSEQHTQQTQQTQQQQTAFQQTAMHQQQQFMGGSPYPGMMFMPMGGANPYLPGPSPEAWAAMVSNQEQLGGVPGGQFNAPPFMMPPFPFYSPENAAAMGFPPATNPQQQQQQQMMFFNAAQQQMHAMQMQAIQYQQALAAQAHMHQHGQHSHQQQQGGQHGGAPGPPSGQSPATSVGSDQHKSLTGGFGSTLGYASAAGSASASSAGGAPGLAPSSVSTATSTISNMNQNKVSEHSESDDLFNLHELNLDSPAFNPQNHQKWMPGGAR